MTTIAIVDDDPGLLALLNLLLQNCLGILAVWAGAAIAKGI
jgi:fluoride ion exporter CrcB/FEX